MTNAQQRRQSDCSSLKSKGCYEVLSIANYAAMDPLNSVKKRAEQQQQQQQHQDDIAVTACAQKLEDAYSCLGDEEDDCLSMDSDDQTVKQGHQNEKKKKKKRQQKSRRRSSHTLTVVTPPPPRNSLDSTFGSDETRFGTRKVQMAPSLSMIYNPLGAKAKVNASPASALKSSASTPAMNKVFLNNNNNTSNQKKTTAALTGLRASDKSLNPPSPSVPSKTAVAPSLVMNMAPPPMRRAVTIDATTKSTNPPSPSFPSKNQKAALPMTLAPPPMRRSVTIDTSPSQPATTAVKLSPLNIPPPPLQRATTTTSAMKSSTRLSTSNKLKGSKSGVNIVRRITSWRGSGNKAPNVTDFFPAADSTAAAAAERPTSPAVPLVSAPLTAAMSKQEKEAKKKQLLSKFSQMTANPITIPIPAAAPARAGAEDAEKERRKQLLQNKWKNITSTTELIGEAGKSSAASTSSSGSNTVKSALQEQSLATRAAASEASAAFPQAVSTPDHLSSMARQSYTLTSSGGLRKNRSFLKKSEGRKSNSNSSGMTAPDTASNQGSEYGSTYSGESSDGSNMKRRKSFFKLKKSKQQPLQHQDELNGNEVVPIRRKSSFFRPKTKSFLKRIVSKTEVSKSNDTWNNDQGSRQFNDPASRPLRG